MESLPEEARLYFRDRLREARAAALGDAEGHGDVIFVLERLGRQLCSPKPVKRFRDLRDPLIEVAEKSAIFHYLNSIEDPFEATLDQIFDGRNDLMHQGSAARALTRQVISVAMVLEDALMDGSEKVLQFMVKDVAKAELWMTIGAIRHEMLANAYSYLPVFLEEKIGSHEPGWYLISVHGLATYFKRLPGERGREARHKKLAMRVREAITPLGGDLRLARAVPVRMDDPIATALIDLKEVPILVFEGESRGPKDLRGILTAFDFL